jgi:hypothetical protein
MNRTYSKHEKAITAYRILDEEVRGRKYTAIKMDQRGVCFEGEKQILLTQDRV